MCFFVVKINSCFASRNVSQLSTFYFSYREGGSFKNGPQTADEAHMVRLTSKLMLICKMYLLVFRTSQICNFERMDWSTKLRHMWAW